jgi:cytochrome b561
MSAHKANKETGERAMVQWRNTDERYGAIAQALHWTIFALVALQFASAELVDAFPRGSAERGLVIDVHESLGLAVLALVMVRLGWRVVNPALPVDGPAWQQRAARAAHVGLYVLMAAVPVAGYVVAGARGHDPNLVGLALPRLFAPDRDRARAASNVHEVLAWAMAALVGMHVAAAVWHHIVARDATLARMLPRRKAIAPAFRR